MHSPLTNYDYRLGLFFYYADTQFKIGIKIIAGRRIGYRNNYIQINIYYIL